MAFTGLHFPELSGGTAFSRVKITHAWPVAVVGNGSVEYRTLRGSFPRVSYEIPARALSSSDAQALRAFYNAVGGEFGSFLFSDYESQTLSAFQIGTGSALPAPAGLAVSVGSSGTLAAGTYSYAVTALTAAGETTPSSAAGVNLAAAGSAVLSWQPVAGASGYNVYRAGKLIGSTSQAVAPTFTDTGLAAGTQAPPATNTALQTAFPLLVPVGGVLHPLYHVDGLTVSPAGGATVQIVGGQPALVFPGASAPGAGVAVTLSGTFSLCVRFDSASAYALTNAANPGAGVALHDTVKLIEVFE